MKLHHAQVSARYTSIMGWLAAAGRVDVVEAASRLGVAQETIRRDLRTLELDGKLQRVHGGAVPVEVHPVPVAPTLPAVHGDDLALATQLWGSLPRSGTILLGTGRLTLALAQVIVASPPEEVGLTVVTNSLDAAVILSRATKLSVYNVGGTVSPLTRAQEGDWALTELSRFSVDVCVISPAGVSVDRGLSEDTPAAAAVSQAAVSAARRVIALADDETLGVTAFVQFATVDEVDVIAVAGSPSPGALQPFTDRGVSIVALVDGSVAGSPIETSSRAAADQPPVRTENLRA